jgi:hypothetical protein
VSIEFRHGRSLGNYKKSSKVTVTIDNFFNGESSFLEHNKKEHFVLEYKKKA